MSKADPRVIAPCRTFNANKGTFPGKLINQIFGGLWSMAPATIQTNTDVRFLFRGWAKISQILITDGATKNIE
jgi:hypothetical protein